MITIFKINRPDKSRGQYSFLKKNTIYRFRIQENRKMFKVKVFLQESPENDNP